MTAIRRRAKRQADLPAPFQTDEGHAGPPSSEDDAERPAAASEDEEEPAETRSPTTTAVDDERTTASGASTSRSSVTTSPNRTGFAASAERSTFVSTSSSSSTSVTSSVTSTSLTTQTPPSQSMIWANTFPSDFPVETPKPVLFESSGRGYAFMKENELLDSLLIFASFIVTSLILTIILVKTTHYLSRRTGSKVDQMVGEDMKWQERREVLERKIVYEGGGRVRGDKRGRGVEAQIGWRELSLKEQGRSKLKRNE